MRTPRELQALTNAERLAIYRYGDHVDCDDGVICPYCGEYKGQSCDHFEGNYDETENECDACGKSYIVRRNISVSYVSEKTGEDEEEVEMKAIDGPFNEKWCSNPYEPEVCRHYEPDYKCSKYGAELAMGCVDPTPETFRPVAIRCVACLAWGGAR